MRIIHIKVISKDNVENICEMISKNMGFLFLKDENTYIENESCLFLNPNIDMPNVDYVIEIEKNNSLILKSKDITVKKTNIQGDKETFEIIKRFILDEESRVYVQKTKNQISGHTKKMTRYRNMEGIFKKNKIQVQDPQTTILKMGKGVIKESKITIYGHNNYLEIKDGYNIVNIEILIRGNNNYILIDENFELNYNTNKGPLCLSAKDDNNIINLGKNIHIRGEGEIVCMEGTKIEIGDNFGMSNETIIRSGDGHRILDKDGNRSNPSKSIKIGKDCWLARRAIVLKGVHLQDYTIVATGALVTKSYDEGNIILGGNPAKIIKKNISWLPGR